MMGHTHVISGVALGAATVSVAPVRGLAGQCAWIAVTAGMAMLPDLDHPRSTVARMWGPVTAAVAHGIRWAARGHRGGTHDIVVAPLAAILVTWLASQHQWTQGLVLAVATGLVLRSIAFAIPGQDALSAAVNLGLSGAAAWLFLEHGAAPSWLPWAVGLGVAVHILGDAVTDKGIPRPFSWVRGRRERLRGGPVRTGGGLEKFLVGPLLAVVAAGLVYLNVPDVGIAVRSAVRAAASASSSGGAIYGYTAFRQGRVS